MRVQETISVSQTQKRLITLIGLYIDFIFIILLLGKCMFLGGLTPKSMCADDDYKLLDYGIGFTNVVMRPTRGSANLTRKEIEDGKDFAIFCDFFVFFQSSFKNSPNSNFGSFG